MKPVFKGLIVVGCICLLVVFAVGGMIFLSLKSYHDKNSWAIFEISGDGIKAGEYKYKCSPDVNVKEWPETKAYGKGETIEFGYASFTVKRVDIGSIKAADIYSEADLVYNGEVLHNVYLKEGESCEIHAQGKKAVIKLSKITYY